MNRKIVPLLFLTSILSASGSDAIPPSTATDEGGSENVVEIPFAPLIRPIAPLLDPVPAAPKKSIESSVNWSGLVRQSGWFLGIEHAFRWATEPGTRNGKGRLFPGYAASVSSLHGWSDGDPFYVNYIGHPMQGAATGYIWVHNDPAYSGARFGANRHYWQSRLRAAAYSWAYSTQFEIGPVSEASIGFIQSRRPQQGLVDHVITPAIGLGWMIAEDALDRYLLTHLERRVQNTYVRIFARGFLNPTRSMANMLRGRVPFYRDDRSIFADRFAKPEPPPPTPASELPADQGVAPLEITAAGVSQRFGPGVCNGGGGEAAFRLARQWQLVVDVNGCMLSGLPRGTSGDVLSYAIGPRWTPSERRLRPYIQFLVGGTKLTALSPEPARMDKNLAPPEAERAISSGKEEKVISDVSNAFSVAAGMGVNLKLGRAAALKLASLEYTRSWNDPLAGIDYNTGLQLKLGVTLRMGTW